MGHAEELAVHVHYHLSIFVSLQDSYKSLSILALGNRPERLHPNLAADDLLEMLGRPQRAIQAGARHLQVVGARDRILDVQSGGDRARHGAAVVQRHPARLVDEKPERLPSTAAADLDVDQLQPLLYGERRSDLPHLLEDLFLATHLQCSGLPPPGARGKPCTSGSAK